jgi:hypothetical protein
MKSKTIVGEIPTIDFTFFLFFTLLRICNAQKSRVYNGRFTPFLIYTGEDLNPHTYGVRNENL